MLPPRHFANRHQFLREDAITSKFIREPIDVDDTVPVELYSRPYERVELQHSTPYELIELEQEIEFTESFDRAAIELIESFDLEAADETGDLVEAPAPSSIALRIVLAISMVGAAFGFGVGFGYLVL